MHFAAGGPSGTDTIPAWLSPGEFVEPTSAVSRYGRPFMDAIRQGRIDPSSVRYFAPGGEVDPPPPPPQPQPQPQPKPPKNTPPPMSAQPGDIHDGLKPTGPGAVSPGSKRAASDLATPGADAQQPGTGLPSMPGIGFSGGLIGGIEGAASSAAAMGADMGTFGGAGGAVSAAMNIGFQELNRAAAFGAQAAGIGVEGLLEGLIPDAGGSGADWAKTIPGRLLMGVTGVRPAASQNTAGQTQQPFASNASDDKFANPAGNVSQPPPIQILGPVHIQANNTDQIHSEINQQTSMAANRFGAAQR
ncbi:hypothetical protein [Mycobacterium sp. SMC-2]|uniref:hypothetical protein n=1 Tax=Mycobacterium sp. SMC-2 TaxID=2857058 RepID=UPI0021B1ADF6|nr:hypothetical protein [Mycobacterium sp. SMC-2]